MTWQSIAWELPHAGHLRLQKNILSSMGQSTMSAESTSGLHMFVTFCNCTILYPSLTSRIQDLYSTLHVCSACCNLFLAFQILVLRCFQLAFHMILFCFQVISWIFIWTNMNQHEPTMPKPWCARLRDEMAMECLDQVLDFLEACGRATAVGTLGAL